MKSLFLFLGLALAVTASARYNPCNQCGMGCDEACGPVEVIHKRRVLLGEALQKTPYSYILHQEISRGGSPNYSRGSFIAPHILITAHHNVMGNVRKLAFCNKSVDTEKWVRFKKKEVKIVHLGRVDAPTDISLIIFKDRTKIAPLYRGHFKPTDKLLASGTPVHLTGFSCDKPDTLLDKHIPAGELVLHPNSRWRAT